MKTKWIKSPNCDERECECISMIVIHYTALSLSETIKRFKDKNSEASAHYIIDRDGSITQMVKDEKKAWHAGESEFEGKSHVNDFSIGIELVNWGPLRKKGGRFYTWKNDWSEPYDGETPVISKDGCWQPFSEEQYETLVQLMKTLSKKYPSITRERIKGHCDVCVPSGRKIDPGDAFDWERILGAVFG